MAYGVFSNVSHVSAGSCDAFVFRGAVSVGDGSRNRNQSRTPESGRWLVSVAKCGQYGCNEEQATVGEADNLPLP